MLAVLVTASYVPGCYCSHLASPDDASEEGADAHDGSVRRPCSIGDVVWAAPAPWVCGRAVEPVIEVVPLDATNATIAAGACGLGVLTQRMTAAVGGERWLDSHLSGYEYRDLARARWVLSSAERLGGLGMLPPLTAVTSVLGGDVVRTGAYDGERWLWQLPELVVVPSAARTLRDGRFGTIRSVDDLSIYGLGDGPGVVEMTIEDGRISSAELLAHGSANLGGVRDGDAAYLWGHYSEPLLWWNGDTIPSGAADASWLLVLSDRTVTLRELSNSGGALPGPDDSFLTIERPFPPRTPATALVTRRTPDRSVFSRELGVEGGLVLSGAVFRPDGRLVLAGVAGGSSLEGAPLDPRTGNGVVMELDPCGTTLWARSFDSPRGDDGAESLTVGPDGTVYGVARVVGPAMFAGTSFGEVGETRVAIFSLAP